MLTRIWCILGSYYYFIIVYVLHYHLHLYYKYLWSYLKVEDSA